jgi:hypothetical protein
MADELPSRSTSPISNETSEAWMLGRDELAGEMRDDIHPGAG